jgi:hypothetical protein
MDWSTLRRLLIGGAALLLLAGAGYVAVDGISSLNDLDETLSTLEAALSAEEPAEAAIEEPAEEPAEAAIEEPTEEPTEEPSQEPTPTPVPDSLKVLFPTVGDTVVIGSEHPEVHVRLGSNVTHTLTDVQVGLLVLNRVTDQDNKEILSPGLTGSSGPITLEPGSADNVAVTFDKEDLPASGTYEGRLLVTANEGKPLSQAVTVVVSRPPIPIQHRLSDETDKTIVLGGVRHWPRCLTEKWPRCLKNVHWDDFQLHLWQSDLRDVPYSLVPSEMIDNETGRWGRLVVTPQAYQPPVDDPGQPPSKFDLSVKDVDYPGTYEGVLAIYSPDGGESQRINVTARVRDALIWPFLVIVGGAGLIGWLLRISVGDSSKSVLFQRFRIAQAQKRLEKVPECKGANLHLYAKCRYIKDRLTGAEAALNNYDVNLAAQYLKQAEDALDVLETASTRLAAADEELETREKKLGIDYGEDTVREQLAQVHDFLKTARRHYEAGDLSRMGYALDDMYRALDQAAKELAEDAARKDAAKMVVEPPRPSLELVAKGPEVDRLKEEGGILIFYTDETIAGSVDGDEQDRSYSWVIEPESPEDHGRKPIKGKTVTYEINAKPEYSYPLRYRVAAKVRDVELAFREFEVRHPYKIELPGVVYAKEPVYPVLAPVHAKEKLPENLEWWISDAGQLAPWKPKRAGHYRTKRPGEYRLGAKKQLEWDYEHTWPKRLVAAKTITVVENPVKVALCQLKWGVAGASLFWALVAGIAGMIYIGERVPTFGSPMDYYLALAWGLGLSTSVAPKQELRAKILQALGITPGSEEAEVPNLVEGNKTKEQAEEELKQFKGKYSVEWLPKEPQEKKGWIVKQQSPLAGTKVKVSEKTEFTITLGTPEEISQAAGEVVVPDLERLVDGKKLTKEQAEEELEKTFKDKSKYEVEWLPEEPADKPGWIVKEQQSPKAGTRVKVSEKTEFKIMLEPSGGSAQAGGSVPTVTEVKRVGEEIALTIVGTGFEEGAQVKLRMEPQPEPEVTMESVTSAQIRCKFKPAGEAIGRWMGVVITPPDKESEPFEFTVPSE